MNTRLSPRAPSRLKLGWGRVLRWYLVRARHPFKDKIVGHWWGWFAGIRVWVPYMNGLVIRVAANDYLQQRILFEGAYEPRLVGWLEENLRPRDVFWDVGANIGAMSLVAARRCKQVIAFEPVPEIVRLLQDNIAANDLNNIRVETRALSDTGGEVSFALAPASNSGMGSIIPAPGRAQIKVRAVRMDEVTESGELPAPNVMKVDVEGAERLVLGGGVRALSNKRLRAVIFESREGAGDLPADRRIVDLLAQAGLSVSIFGRSDPNADDDMMNYIARR